MLLIRFSASEVTKVVLPESLIIIADYAFTDCTSLTEIELNCPNAKIESMAFSNTGLTKAVIILNDIGKCNLRIAKNWKSYSERCRKN